MFEKEINGLKRKIPIIFPNELVHLEVAKALSKHVETSKIVGAGDISIGVLTIGGESTTIKIKSKKGDDIIINNYDYSNGLEDALNIFGGSIQE